MFPSVNFHKIPLDYKLENANRNVLIDTLVIIKMVQTKAILPFWRDFKADVGKSQWKVGSRV